MEQDLAPDAYEIIVIDDESTDNTPQIARRFVSEGTPSFRYIRQSYGGLSVARNRAIREGRGDLLCFIDDDAVATPSWLSGMVDAADRHRDIECFGGKLLLRLEARPPRTCEHESLGATLDLGTEEVPADHVKGANFGVRRSAFERIGMFNPALVWRGDEDNWMKRLHEAGGSALYVPGAFVWHRRTPSDLRLWNLLKTRFGWGVGAIQLQRESNIPFDRVLALKAVKWHLTHFVRDRCTGGLLTAAIRLGQLWAITIGELRKPRQDAPMLPSPEDAA